MSQQSNSDFPDSSFNISIHLPDLTTGNIQNIPLPSPKVSNDPAIVEASKSILSGSKTLQVSPQPMTPRIHRNLVSPQKAREAASEIRKSLVDASSGVGHGLRVDASAESEEIKRYLTEWTEASSGEVKERRAEASQMLFHWLDNAENSELRFWDNEIPDIFHTGFVKGKLKELSIITSEMLNANEIMRLFQNNLSNLSEFTGLLTSL